MIASGTIQAFDQAERTLTLEGGQHFHLGAAIDVLKLRAGAQVKLVYEAVDKGVPTASWVEPYTPGSPDPMPVKPPAAKPVAKVNTTASMRASKA